MNQDLRALLQHAMDREWCLHPVYRTRWRLEHYNVLAHNAGTRNDRKFKRVTTVATEVSNGAGGAASQRS